MYTADRTKNIASGTRGKVYKEALKLQASGEKVLKINTGNPAAFGFSIPESLKRAITSNIENLAAYTESCGIDEARKAILDYDLKKGFKNITIDDIFIGNGVSELAELVCLAIVNREDEVLCPSPNYNLWSNSVYLADGKPVFYECHEDNEWLPDPKEMEALITDKTKAIVVINPNNPTGALYPDELLLDIIDIARRHNLLIFADEIYDRLVFDDLTHTSVAALCSDVPIITFNGLSKSHIICGLRAGWMTLSGFLGNDKDLKAVIDSLLSVRLCSNTSAQYCIPAALKDPVFTKSMIVSGGRLYNQRKACLDAIKNSKYLEAVENKGALYCFVKIDPEKVHIENDKEFAIELIKAKHVMVVPGSGFDYPKPNYFRVVMLPRSSELVNAITAIDDFCDSYSKK